MPRRAAVLTQADVARTIRAAKQAGASNVEVRPDGTILVHLHEQEDSRPQDRRLEPKRELVF